MCIADSVATASNVWNCSSTHSTNSQNLDALRNLQCMGDTKMNAVDSVASEIVPSK